MLPLLRRSLLAVALASLAAPVLAQPDLPFATFAQFTDSLAAIGAIADDDARDDALDALWTDLVAAEQVPFALGDSAAFLYRGSAGSVQVAGDHSSWSPRPLSRVGLSDAWLRVYSFPEAARLDYKLVVDGNWILDPDNPHQQWSGFGPNSELRMPAWVFPDETVRDPDVPAGAFTANQSLTSTHLGYTVRYRVYTPADYDTLADLPAIYVTDGHEYADDRLGAFRIVLDNLIAEGRAEPAVVVFIDPRVNGQNLREEQYVQNPDFASFVADELVPTIDAAYRTRTDRDSRVILGTSLGGLFSAYLGILHPDTFGKLAIQSPAFWVSENPNWWTGPSIYSMMDEAEAGLFDVYMSTGTINDTEDGARRMRDVFDANDHALAYREVPEGHSWGNWRALLDEVLVALLPGAATDAEDTQGAAPNLLLPPYPNPARGRVRLHFSLPAPALVRLRCYDLLGRRGADPVDGEVFSAGDHSVTVTADELGAAGAYICRLSAGAHTAARLITILH